MLSLWRGREAGDHRLLLLDTVRMPTVGCTPHLQRMVSPVFIPHTS